MPLGAMVNVSEARWVLCLFPLRELYIMSWQEDCVKYDEIETNIYDGGDISL